MSAVATQIAQELAVKPQQVNAAITLLDDGATVPFIARYRKEATQGLDDQQLRLLAQRLTYLRDLNDRRNVILTNIEQQGKLTPALKEALLNADNKTRLEDLYLPFKPKRRTKGQIAIEAGLSPLADLLISQLNTDPEAAAAKFVSADNNIEDVAAALDGAQSILIERMAEDADLIQKLRRLVEQKGWLHCKVVKKKQQEAQKYKDYFEHSELYKKVPSHRALAMLRGRNEQFLQLAIRPAAEADEASVLAEDTIRQHLHLNLTQQAAAPFIEKVIRHGWKSKIGPQLETELLGKLRDSAEVDAIDVFAKNLRDLLMAAPAGAKATLGLDPGYRTGCKIAVVDATGKLLHTATIFPHEPQNNWDKSVRTLVNLCRQHKVELIAVGNGTASRESDKLVSEVIKALEGKSVQKLIVSEAGASVYSASELAANEFPDIDVSIRGAISIARRLQDPLAELVKIEPKAIGVGQYQHDVSQSKLTASLDDVIEDCVNAVGVDANSASAALLSRVAGLSKTMAQNMVAYRDEHGRFSNRNEFKKVARLGPKAFEQAAGFLRIRDGENPIDASGVHPETYPVVDKIIQSLSCDVSTIFNNSSLLNEVNAASLADNEYGEITVNDIIEELKKPGRDPRPEFKTAQFKEGVETINDLKIGMILEGVVSNVAQFGAFVDLGVHQDGLVHISAMTNKFISDPHDIVKAGDIVKVKVTEVDAGRKRISLTMRLDDAAPAGRHNQNTGKADKARHQKPHTKQHSNKAKPKQKAPDNAAMGNAFAEAFAKAKK